jgi:hypothetical protein
MFQLGYQENTAQLSLHIPAVEDKKLYSEHFKQLLKGSQEIRQ